MRHSPTIGSYVVRSPTVPETVVVCTTRKIRSFLRASAVERVFRGRGCFQQKVVLHLRHILVPLNIETPCCDLLARLPHARNLKQPTEERRKSHRKIIFDNSSGCLPTKNVPTADPNFHNASTLVLGPSSALPVLVFTVSSIIK